MSDRWQTILAVDADERAAATYRALALMSIIPLWAAVELRDYATGRARYELRDNPDGSKTYQRVEVQKP